MSNDLFGEAEAILARNPSATTPVEYEGQGNTVADSLRKGWNSGLLGAGSQLQSVAGLAGEALGADEFASNRRADSMALRRDAEAAAPQIGRWDQVNGVGDFAKYAAGLVGGSAPISIAGMGAAALTGGGVVPGILAAGAATAPFEMGDVIQKQEADPEAMQKSAGERLGAAALGGGVSALAQGVVPGIVGKQLKGLGATRAAGQSVKGVLAQNLAGDALLEGGAEGGGDVIKQYAANPNRDIDWDSVKENAIGGAVAGGAMGGVGATGDLVHRNGPMIGDALSSVRTSINDRLSKLRGAAGEKIDAAAETAPGQKVKGVYDDISDMLQRGKSKFDDTVDKVMKGEELGIDPQELATATSERMKEMFDFSDNEKVKAATKWGKEMMDDAGLDEAKRQEVADALSNVKDRAGQVAMAGLKKTWDLGRAASAKIDAFTSAVKKGREEYKRGDVEGEARWADEPAADTLQIGMAPKAQPDTATKKPTIAERKAFIDEQVAKGKTPEEARAAFVESLTKKSEDYSGTQQVILKALQENGLAQRRPDLFANSRKVNELADGMRVLMERLARGPLDDDTLSATTRLLGEDTTNVVVSLKKALGTELDPKQTETLFQNLNKAKEIADRSNSLHDVMRRSFTEDAQRTTSPATVEDDARALIAHARGHTAGERTAERQHFDALVDAFYKEKFGDKADVVRAAVEKEAGLGNGAEATSQTSRAKGSDDQFNAETGERQSPEALETMKFGLTEPDAKGNSKSKLNGELMAADSRYTKQHIEDLKVKYPKHDVRWEKAEGSDLGHIVVEKAADPEALTTADVESMRLDKKYPNSPDKITVGGVALDTKRIAKVMDRRLEYSAADEQSRAHRMARMFNEGVARLMELHGKIDVPDSAVIGEVGGKPFTFGMAKKLKNDTAKAEHPRLAELREEYKTASDQDREKIKAEVQALKDAELTADPNESRSGRYDADGKLTSEGARALLEGDFHGGVDTAEIAARRSGRAAEDGSSRAVGEDRVRIYEKHDQGQGRRQIGNDENVHLAAAVQGDRLKRDVNMDGSKHSHNASDRANLREKLGLAADELKARTSKVQRALGDKLKSLTTPEAMVRMGAKGQAQLARVLVVKKPSEMAAIINPLVEKYGKPVEVAAKEPTKNILADAIAKRQEYLNNPPADYSTEKARGILDWAATQKERVDGEYEKAVKEKADADRQDQLSDYRSGLDTLIKKAKAVLEGDASLADKEGAPDPKQVAAKKAAFLERAASGDKALIKELSTSNDAKGLQRAIGALADTHPDSEAMRVATARLSELVKNPDTSYGLQTTKYSLESAEGTDPNATHTQAYRDSVKDHITKVLGSTVKVAWKNLTTMQHAGDYTHTLKLIRLSVHALDPMSTAYHESLHAFFAQLRDAGAKDITGVLEKAASSQHVVEQLRERYKNQPEVLKQLADPEERAAYMYQTWATDPTFTISPSAKGVFARIKEFITRLMGAWTNDERALHIMKYFHSGEYAKNMGSPSGVRAALMDRNRSQVLETARSFTEPLAKLADAVVGTGGARLRDTGIPALSQLADIMKREHTAKGGDQGFIQASRVEAAKMRTRLGVLLEPYTKEHLRDAMDALQSDTPAVSAEGRLAARAIKGFLRDAHGYMKAAGVDIGDLGPDYFPRVWDTHYISKNQQAFRDMLEPYIRSGEMKGSADELIRNLTTREGVELGIESREPGMQFKKERVLSFITPQDAAQFMEKDLLGTLSSYINQAARKAEWTRRLGRGKLETLMDEAKQQGATKEHIELAETYMKGIDGTLGDDLNPTARRVMGDMIVYQNVRLLPTAAFSMLIDPNGVMVRGGTVGDAWATFKRGMAGIKDTFKKDGGEASADQATKWAELVGVVDSAMMSHAMGDVFSQGMVGGTAQKINNAFFKYNLVEGLNRNFRIGATEAAIKFLARHAGGLEGLGSSQHSERWMKELGLQKGDIKATPEGYIALTELEGLQAAQVRRVHAAINQWVDGAVLRPDASDKPIWMNDPHYALISHLKQFVFSFQKTILERVAHEFKHGNYAPMMALASYVPIMMAADMAKGLLVTGGDTPEWQKGWGPAEYLGYGVERAGLFGVGQFGVDVVQDLHRGGMGVGALSGPTIEQFGDIVSTLGGHKQFGNTVIDAMPANVFMKGWSGHGESKADPNFAD